jgi:hypothetical protein
VDLSVELPQAAGPIDASRRDWVAWHSGDLWLIFWVDRWLIKLIRLILGLMKLIFG